MWHATNHRCAALLVILLSAMISIKESCTYYCNNDTLLFNRIRNIWINNIPYFLQSIDNIIVIEVPWVRLFCDPPKEGRNEFLMPTILAVDAVWQIFVIGGGLSAILSAWFVC